MSRRSVGAWAGLAISSIAMFGMIAAACGGMTSDSEGVPTSGSGGATADAGIGSPGGTGGGGTSGGTSADSDPPVCTRMGPVRCTDDAHCAPRLEEWTEPAAASLGLVSARCAHLEPAINPVPVCHCVVHRQPTGEPGSDQTLYAGHRGFPQQQGCSEWGRTGACLYCAHEFAGCHLDSPESSCRAICEEMFGRVRQDLLRTFEVRVRVARCECSDCEQVIEIDGRCHVNVVQPDSKGYDCSLSDEELLAKGTNREPSCQTPPVRSCVTTDDCPGGLACNSGRCGPCSEQCSGPLGDPTQVVCEGDAACKSGEKCALQLCVPEAQVGCRGFWQCPAEQSCVLSGVDFQSIRGNAQTRTFCQP